MSDVRVRASLGQTVNLGDFESMRVDVSIEDSARPGEKAGEAFDRVWSLVETKLLDKLKRIQELTGK